MKASGKKATKKRDIGAELQAEAEQAALLVEQVEALTAQLEALKAGIREKVASLNVAANTFEFPTSFGPCKVTRVKDAMGVAPGFDPDVLRHTMPEELWHAFFTVKTVLRSDADAAYERLTPAQRKALGTVDPFQFSSRQSQVKLPRPAKAAAKRVA